MKRRPPWLHVLMAAAWLVLAWGLHQVEPPHGEPLHEPWPVLLPRLLPPAVWSALLVMGAVALLIPRRVAWLVALTVAAASALVHLVQAFAVLPFLAYLLSLEARRWHRIDKGEAGDFTVSRALAVISAGTLAAVLFMGWIWLPGMGSTLQRAKAKRTMGDMRLVDLAVQSYASTHGAPPLHSGSVEGIRELLEPTHLKRLPVKDGWGGAIRYDCSTAAPASYRIESLGRDGVPSGPREGQVPPGPDDLILVDGSFLTYI